MEKLEEAFKEALANNTEEVQRWTTYKEEQETAINNMKHFSEKIAIDVMVPVGSKAFMPGQLYHTNEILVSHYRGIFSKCSSHQAQQIAARRMEMAKQRLESLETERKMYQNKLDLPHSDGVFSTGEEHDIIEEYNEEEEKRWRVEHKHKVREAKLKESKQFAKAKDNQTHEDVMKQLDDLEMMEELEEELSKLQVEDDETLKKLMAGEIQLPPEKKRTSHHTEYDKDIVIGENQNITRNSAAKKPSVVDEIWNKMKTFNTNEPKKEIDFTNNNTMPNGADYDISSDESDNTSEGEIPECVLEIERRTKDLPAVERVKHFKRKLREIVTELHEFKVKSPEDINRKMDLLEIRDYLTHYIDILDEDDDGAISLANQKINTPAKQAEKPVKKKKRITFSNEDEVQFIDKNQAPNAVMRSKIELSDDSYNALKMTPPSKSSSLLQELPAVDKKHEIAEKVRKNVEFISENQSQQDFNLVDKILNAAEMSKSRTLYLQISHSDTYFENSIKSQALDDQVIGSPADIYETFKDRFPSFQQSPKREVLYESDTAMVNGSGGNNVELSKQIAFEEDEKGIRLPVKSPTTTDDTKWRNKTGIQIEEAILKENNHIPVIPAEPVKSILRNKEKVQLEKIDQTVANMEEKKRPKKSKSRKEKEELPISCFDLVVSDIVENARSTSEIDGKIKTEPDPLPSEKFVDVHVPKKRVSRFKQMRTST